MLVLFQCDGSLFVALRYQRQNFWAQYWPLQSCRRVSLPREETLAHCILGCLFQVSDRDNEPISRWSLHPNAIVAFFCKVPRENKHTIKHSFMHMNKRASSRGISIQSQLRHEITCILHTLSHTNSRIQGNNRSPRHKSNQADTHSFFLRAQFFNHMYQIFHTGCVSRPNTENSCGCERYSMEQETKTTQNVHKRRVQHTCMCRHPHTPHFLEITLRVGNEISDTDSKVLSGWFFLRTIQRRSSRQSDRAYTFKCKIKRVVEDIFSYYWTN